jgi:SAM-dependent methyltransferase
LRCRYNNYYETRAAHFDKLRLDQTDDIQKTVDAFVGYLPSSTSSGPLLDLGCGTGRYCSYLTDLGYSIVGQDVSGQQLLHAQKRISVVRADAARLPYKSACFDACLMFLVLHQISDADRLSACVEVYRTLTRNGVFVIKTSSHEELRMRQFGQFFPSALAVNLARYPDCPMLAATLREIGFSTIVEIKVYTSRDIEVSDLMHSIERQHNTTLALIPKSEFDEGVKSMRRAFLGLTMIPIFHYHTLLIATKI